MYVYNDESQVLLQLRHPDRPWGANKWDFSGGGHISADETPAGGAVREASEEIGLGLSIDDLTLVGVTRAVSTRPATERKHMVHEWNFIIKKDVEPSALRLQDSETVEAKWFSIDEIESDLDDKDKVDKYAPRSKDLYLLFTGSIRSRLNND